MERDIRIPLEKGTQLTINGSVFTIGDVIGRGGLSLVYFATKEGGMTESVIKEFYPAMDRSGVLYAERDADGRVFCSNERFQEQFANTQKLFNCEGAIGGDVADVSFQIVPFWEHQNGYAVMKKESADMHSLRTLVHEWETNPPLSLGSKKWDDNHIYGDVIRVNYALTVIDSLLTALSAIHEKYLHLDLSSTNVIWACRELSTGRNGFAVISDFGSAATLENGEFKPNYNLFSSAGFAAPEIYNRNCTLTRKTDLYSVGMLLIYLCIGEKDFIKHFGRMKRAVQLGRDIAGISLDIQEYFGSQLYEILMAVLVERKYTTAQEMQKDIQELHDKTNIYLLDQETAAVTIGYKINGIGDNHYIPRKREMAEIVDRLDRNETPIFLTGIGGIGKTTLAQRYAIEYAGTGRFVSFTAFTSSFRETIASLDPNKCKDKEWTKKPLDEKFEAGLALLRSCSSNYVLIIDNADTKNDLRSDPDYHFLQEVSMSFIITTRNRMEGDEVIHLKEMDEENVLALMKSYLPEHRNGQHDPTLQAIIEQVDRHTLTAELLAKTLRETIGLSPKAVLESLKKSAINDKEWETIETMYHASHEDRTVYEHLRTAFNLSNLNDADRQILACFCLSKAGYTEEYVVKLFSRDQLKVINALIRRGWLRKEIVNIRYKRITSLGGSGESDFEISDFDTSPGNNEFIKGVDESGCTYYDILHIAKVYSLHPVIRALCLLDENTQPLWRRIKDFIREAAIIFFNRHKEDPWDWNGEKRKDLFNCIESMEDFELIETEDKECASLLYLCLIVNCSEQYLKNPDINIVNSQHWYISRIRSALEHNSTLFYVALQLIKDKAIGLKNYQKLNVFLYLSHLRTNSEALQSSEYSKRFLEYVYIKDWLLDVAYDLERDGQQFLLFKEYEWAYSQMIESYFWWGDFVEIFKSEDPFNSDERIMSFANLLAEKMIFGFDAIPFQTLILLGLLTRREKESLMFVKVGVVYLEVHTFINKWALNPRIHTETEYAEIQASWESKEIMKQYEEWLGDIARIAEKELNYEDPRCRADFRVKQLQDSLISLVIMCETGYYVALRTKQESLVEEFKLKYRYYLTLLATHFSSEEENDKKEAEILCQMVVKPFNPPMIDDIF